MQILINLSAEEINALKQIKEIRDEHDVIFCVHELIDRVTAKNPKFYAHNYYCDKCGNLVGNDEFKWKRFMYCDQCGQ